MGGKERGIANARRQTKNSAMVVRKSGLARTMQIPHTTSTNLLGQKAAAREARPRERGKERERESEGSESGPLVVAFNGGNEQPWRQTRCVAIEATIDAP